MSDTKMTFSKSMNSASLSMIWSPERMAKPRARSMTTSPNMTGTMPFSMNLRMTSCLSMTRLRSSMTMQDPGGTETEGMPAAFSSATTMPLRSLTS